MKKGLLAVFSLLSVLLVFGCKTAKVEEPLEEVSSIHPAALLSDDLSIYMSMNVLSHRELFADVLCALADSLERDNALMFADRAHVLYTGLGTVKDRSHLECTSRVNIPRVAIPAVFSKKNGWNADMVHVQEKTFVRYVNQDTPFQVSFPEISLFTAAQDVSPMLEKFSAESQLSSELWCKWICQDFKNDEIFFYVTRPGQYLRSFIGQSINVGTDSIFGTLVRKDDSKKGRILYNMTLNIHFKEKRSVSVIKSLLSVTFSMLGGQVDQTDEFTVRISNVEVTDRQIIDLFTRDPVTGKHYRVVGEEVIEESIKK